MKRKVIAVICLLAVLVVGALSVQAYNHYRQTRNAQAAAAAKEATLEAQGKAIQQATFNTEVDKLEALCHKDYLAYQALPATQQAKQQAPNCSLQFVQ